MACNTGFDPWVFHTINDRTLEDIRLNFCLKVVRGRVTGEVFDALGQPLSTDPSVVGMRVPMPMTAEERAFMTLDFRWDKNAQPIRVFMIGHVFKDLRLNQLKFDGRFQARAGEVLVTQESQSTFAGPDDGDTGTGSGTQT